MVDFDRGDVRDTEIEHDISLDKNADGQEQSRTATQTVEFLTKDSLQSEPVAKLGGKQVFLARSPPAFPV